MDPEGSLAALEQLSQLLAGRWEGEAQSHSFPRVPPLLRRVGPIMKSSFLSLQSTMGPLLCNSLCPPGPVSGTAAVSGGDGLGAHETTTCSCCSLLPSLSLTPRPSLPATHTSIHVFLPVLRCCGRIKRGMFAYMASWLLKRLCRASASLGNLYRCTSPSHLNIPFPCHQGGS